jgi:DhnA family fructose-bisphosphate aldolase class Ia
MIGKTIRMTRLINQQTGNSLVLPFDHGYFLGLIEGAADFRHVVETASTSRADAVLITRGIAQATADLFGGKKGLILRISGTTGLTLVPDYEVIVTSVESAVALGADAVAVTIWLGTEHEQEMVAGLGRVVDECGRYGLPVLGEIMFGRGLGSMAFDPTHVAWAARLGQEAGVDILKLNYPGSAAGMRLVTSGISIPVVVAGGAKMETEADVVRMAIESMVGGATGTVIGRNVFQARNPAALLAKLAAIVHDGDRS